jgi:lysophospholipase L1-like esterase
VAGNTGDEFGAEPGRYYADDEFHPSDAGYALWAEAVLDTLERLGVATGAAPLPAP